MTVSRWPPSPPRAKWHSPSDLPVPGPLGVSAQSTGKQALLRVFLLSSPSLSEIPAVQEVLGARNLQARLCICPRWPRVCLPSSSGGWISGPWGPTSCSSAAHPPLHPLSTGRERPNLNNPQQLRGPSRKLPTGGCPSPSKFFLTLS